MTLKEHKLAGKLIKAAIRANMKMLNELNKRSSPKAMFTPLIVIDKNLQRLRSDLENVMAAEKSIVFKTDKDFLDVYYNTYKK